MRYDPEKKKKMIKVIEIENIKGIQSKRFSLNIYPNKPSLLVAPNGFGKSSFATGFNSMNSNRIILSDENYFNNNSANMPRIFIEYEKENNITLQLEATHNSNTISNELDYFVINNLTKPKGIGSQYGRATAVLQISDVVLIDRIPDRINFNYSFSNCKHRFGSNSKVLPNAANIFNNLLIIERISQSYINLQRANGARIQQQINTIVSEINQQQGTSNILINWINENKLNDLKQIQYLNTIGNLINGFDTGLNSEIKSYLVALQIIWLYNSNPQNFKNACKFSNYKLDKERITSTLLTFDNTGRSIRPTETHRKLVVKFPNANQISNGQRDILTFISMLFRAKRHLNKRANILIIDEVFDYLDDANLTAAQYYITELIKEYKEKGIRIYPLILTHLNPNYFKNFAFSNQKVYYLYQASAQVNTHIQNLIRNRNNILIKEDVAKYLFHFHPQTINKRDEFRNLNLPELWGENHNFRQHIFNEVDNYLNNMRYDPFAVCGALRIKIEEIAYNKLDDINAKEEFLNVHKTRNKLDKAKDSGVIMPETHYLLGIIYNEGMHWKQNQDNISPIVSKLDNLTIKKLIKDVFYNNTSA